MKISIRTKLLLGFTLLLVLSTLVQALSLSIVGSYIYGSVKNIQLVEANRGVRQVQTFFAHLNSVNFGLAKFYAVSQASGSAITADYMEQAFQIESTVYPQVLSYSLLSREGATLAQFSRQVANSDAYNEIDHVSFAKVLDGSTVISKVYDNEDNSSLLIDIFTPVFVNNEVEAVIRSQIDLESLRLKMNDIKIGENGYIVVVDETGRTISHPSRNIVLQKTDLSKQKIIASVLDNKKPTDEEEQFKNVQDIVVSAKAARVPGLNWVVIFQQPVPEVLSFVEFLRSLFIFNLVGSLMILLAVALLLSENISGPIKKLIYLTGLLEQGKLDNKIVISTGDEIETLAKSFNAMAIGLIQRENYLKRQEKEKETILQSLSDAVFAVNVESKIVMFNKVAEKITGLQGESILYKNVDEVLKLFDNDQNLKFDQYKIRAQDLTLKLNGKGQYLKRLNGEKIKVSLFAAPVDLGDSMQNSWVLTIRDLSREQELEEMKVDFVSMAAHELRTPLTAIRGYASLLNIQNTQSLDSNSKNLIAHLLISTDNLNNLIDNLLNISRIERNTLGVQVKPLNIKELIVNIIKGLKQQAYIANQKLELDLPQEELPMVNADPFRIGQVLSNLTVNALNYTQEGGSIKVRARKNGDFIEISISDNGPGIKKEAIPHLFTKFFRITGQPEQGSNGTGLGLFICKSIVDMHHGKIWVESELGAGSTFTFSLPVIS